MRRSSRQNYICWRCLCLSPAERALLPRRTLASATAAFSALATSTLSSSSSSSSSLPSPRRALVHPHIPGRSLSTASTASPASGLNENWSSDLKDFRVSSQESSIRERLRKWEEENPAPALAAPLDEPPTDGVGNTFTKTRSELSFKLDLPSEDDAATQPHFDGVDVVDLGLNGSVLQPGDLVEVRYGRRPATFRRFPPFELPLLTRGTGPQLGRHEGPSSGYLPRQL